MILGRRRDEDLLDESVRHRDLAEGHPEGPAPHLEALDVEHGGLVLGEQQHDVLPGKKPLQTHLGLEVRPEKRNIKTPSNKITGPQDTVASAVMISNDDFHIKATGTIMNR